MDLENLKEEIIDWTKRWQITILVKKLFQIME